jgi:hypothetical protein
MFLHYASISGDIGSLSSDKLATTPYSNINIVILNQIIQSNSKNEKPIIYTCFGALGDLMHLLYVINIKFLITGRRGKLLISNRAFTQDVFITHKNTYDFIMMQPCIASYEVDANPYSAYEYTQSNTNDHVNLNDWRFSRYCYTMDWYTNLEDCYNLNLRINPPWLVYTNTNVNKNKFEDMIVIHRSPRRNIDNFPWETILKTNRNVIFVSCVESEYENFKYKNLVEFWHAKTFDDLVCAIYNCKYFIGNLSCPLALAYGFAKPCLGELERESFYGTLTKYHPNFSWISKENTKIFNTDGYLTLDFVK